MASAGAYHSLQRLRGSCDLVVVTSRQHCIQQPTLAWVQEHFPDVFREVHFGNHWALEGKSRAKSEICRSTPFRLTLLNMPPTLLQQSLATRGYRNHVSSRAGLAPS